MILPTADRSNSEPACRHRILHAHD
jgi:hypothetical protein